MCMFRRYLANKPTLVQCRVASQMCEELGSLLLVVRQARKSTYIKASQTCSGQIPYMYVASNFCTIALCLKVLTCQKETDRQTVLFLT